MVPVIAGVAGRWLTRAETSFLFRAPTQGRFRLTFHPPAGQLRDVYDPFVAILRRDLKLATGPGHRQREPVSLGASDSEPGDDAPGRRGNLKGEGFLRQLSTVVISVF